MKAIISFISLKFISPFRWDFIKYFFTGRLYDLTPEDREYARSLMSIRPYLWVSRRETHLTTYLICFSDYALSLWTWTRSGFSGRRPRFGFWSHAFMNYDDNEIVEAIGKGVSKNFFDLAFNCDAVAALLPANLTPMEWDDLQPLIRSEMLRQLGKKYDTVFDLSEDERVSCIELVRVILRNKVHDYELKFSDFERMIKLYKNVTPQMLYESPDFVCVWEKKR